MSYYTGVSISLVRRKNFLKLWYKTGVVLLFGLFRLNWMSFNVFFLELAVTMFQASFRRVFLRCLDTPCVGKGPKGLVKQQNICNTDAPVAADLVGIRSLLCTWPAITSIAPPSALNMTEQTKWTTVCTCIRTGLTTVQTEEMINKSHLAVTELQVSSWLWYTLADNTTIRYGSLKWSIVLHTPFCCLQPLGAWDEFTMNYDIVVFW